MLNPIREQIKTILSNVPGIGVVHDYDRWAVSWSRLLELFRVENTETDKGHINGAIITRTATPETWLTNIEYVRVYEFMIRMLYSLQDEAESELVFQGLIEGVCDAFRDNNTLNGTCETVAPEYGRFRGMSGIQVQTVGVRMFGGVLCHYAELGLGAQYRGDR